MKLNILCLEPFYGGSHKTFIDGLIEHSAHEYTLHTLPSRFWKWRMRGAALHFYNEVKDPQNYDLLLTCGLLSVSDIKALWGVRCPPTVVYMHETQLSYPLNIGEKLDFHYGFTDITTGLTADKIIFNSRFHRNDFLSALPGFIKRLPDGKPDWAVEVIRQKAMVLYPGCSLNSPNGVEKPARDNVGKSAVSSQKSPLGEGLVQSRGVKPLIIWNHRWEHDKDPASFFNALYELDKQGLAFELAILGENFKKVPEEFGEAKLYFAERVVQYGWCDSRAEYQAWLEKGDIVVSTARQENFGISIVEAVAAGCFPLLPNRLSYPELLPEKFHDPCLYKEGGLVKKLGAVIEKINRGEYTEIEAACGELRQHYGKFSWERSARLYDKAFEEIYMAGMTGAGVLSI
ncbi:MAG: DUF3524 domain-containing protein [Spirochaetales bacterium]|nr:DUF3524 domain-containing protein [Spirochaetales bacterium]